MNSDDWKAILRGGVSEWLRMDYPAGTPVYLPTGQPDSWSRLEQIPPAIPAAADIQAPGVSDVVGVNWSSPWVIGGAVLLLGAVVLAVAKS